MVDIITQEEAVSRLQKASREAGGTLALARAMGVSPALISLQLNGRRAIGGIVAKSLGLKPHKEVTITYTRVEE